MSVQLDRHAAAPSATPEVHATVRAEAATFRRAAFADRVDATETAQPDGEASLADDAELKAFLEEAMLFFMPTPDPPPSWPDGLTVQGLGPDDDVAAAAVEAPPHHHGTVKYYGTWARDGRPLAHVDLALLTSRDDSSDVRLILNQLSRVDMADATSKGAGRRVLEATLTHLVDTGRCPRTTPISALIARALIPVYTAWGFHGAAGDAAAASAAAARVDADDGGGAEGREGAMLPIECTIDDILVAAERDGAPGGAGAAVRAR